MPVNALGEYRPHPPKISKGKRLAIYIRDNWTCQYCGRVFAPTDGKYAPLIEERNGAGKWDYTWLELDHILPRALGGDDTEENLRAACTPCNKRKLATTSHTKWEIHIRLARDVLEAGTADENTAKKAAALLLGYLQSDLPKPKGRREAGF